VISAGSPCGRLGVRIPVVSTVYFSFSFSLFFFLFLSRKHLPKVTFVFLFLVLKKKKLSGALNHSFISIAFALTISRRFVKEKPQRLSLN